MTTATTCTDPSVVQVVELVQSANLPIPSVRRAAIVESLRRTALDGMTEIFMETVAESPYLRQDLKTKLANHVLEGEWDEIAQLVVRSCSGTNDQEQQPQRSRKKSTNNPLTMDHYYFTRMAFHIFRTSRKIARAPVHVRTRLMFALHLTSTPDEVVNLLLETLPQSVAIPNPETRRKIANDVLDCRYYRLLLPDRLDCDDLPRLSSPADGPTFSGLPPVLVDADDTIDECPICLDTMGSNNTTQSPNRTHRLKCGHLFCTGCIQDWSRSVGGLNCPLCRWTLQVPHNPVEHRRSARSAGVGRTRQRRSWRPPSQLR